MSLRLDWCSYEAAKWAVEHWHYSHKIPKGRINTIGVWENNTFIGVIVFGHGATDAPAKSVGCSQWEACELQRVALTTHQSSVTKIVAISIKMLRKKNPGIKCIVSYADDRQGHIGGIYQGGNWIYTGTTSGGTEYKWNGEWVHSRAIGHISKKLGMNRAILAEDKRPAGFRYRYVMPLTKAMRDQIELLRKPYPKRASVVEDKASDFQSEDGGIKSDPEAPD